MDSHGFRSIPHAQNRRSSRQKPSQYPPSLSFQITIYVRRIAFHAGKKEVSNPKPPNRRASSLRNKIEGRGKPGANKSNAKKATKSPGRISATAGTHKSHFLQTRNANVSDTSSPTPDVGYESPTPTTASLGLIRNPCEVVPIDVGVGIKIGGPGRQKDTHGRIIVANFPKTPGWGVRPCTAPIAVWMPPRQSNR